MFKELRKIISKKLRENMKITFSQQIENIIKEVEIVKRNQAEFLELQSIRTEMKNSLKMLKRFKLSEESICEPQDRSIEII